MNKTYKTKHFKSAEALWSALSPTKELFKEPCELIYRGQADADWELIPTVLRKQFKTSASCMFGNDNHVGNQIFYEMMLLERFADFCDQIGLRIPNDSKAFRENYLSTNNLSKFVKNPTLWPSEKIIEVMAFAQHHGVPTRLLDWTRQPYVAAYFAASTALSEAVKKDSKWIECNKLAIWVLNIESIGVIPSIHVEKVPGSVSPYLSAQSGLFTVHPHNDNNRNKPFEVRNLESEFPATEDSPLLKITLPIKQSVRLLELCNKVGITGAVIYPSADGAGKAVTDSMNLMRVGRQLIDAGL